MKVEALIKSLEAAAEHTPGAGNGFGEFALVARKFGAAKTVKTFAVALEDLSKSSRSHDDGARLGSLRDSTDLVLKLARLIASKAVIGELAEFARILREYSDVPLKALEFKSAEPRARTAAPLRIGLVNQYQREIASTKLGSAELTAIFDRLAVDKKMRALEMAALATAIAYETPPTTKRPDALKRVRQKHESFLTSAAKSDALKGSSAT